MANSSMFVLPKITMSGSSSRAGHRGAVRRDPAFQDLGAAGGRGAGIGEDVLQGEGTPASGPTGSPAAILASTRAADARARSPSTYRKACISPSTSAIRSR